MTTSLYIPGTTETDPKKQNRSLQVIGSQTATNTDSIATNTTNIATNTTNIATNTTNIATLQAQAFLKGSLFGLTLSTAGSSSTFGIAAGVCSDSTAVSAMNLASAYTKTTSAWAVGTGNGALDTGAVANSTWYHVFVIQRTDTGVVDILFSLSATAPTMPAGYTLKRRIGSMKTDGSAHWALFHQNGDEFLWDLPIGDVVGNTGLSTTPTAFTLSVPTGIIVNVRMILLALNTAAGATFTCYSSVGSSQAGATADWQIYIPVANTFSAADLNIRTNTSGQVMVVGSAVANNTVYLTTKGWIDTRGRLA